MVIAIDGPACSGKSTLAVLTAKKLGIHFLNTGMIFRAIAYCLDKNGIDVNDTDALIDCLNKCNIDVEYKGEEQIVYIDGEDTSSYVSLPKISHLASEYSKLNFVREKVKHIQHQFAKSYDLVVEGRDIGTEIFPNAEYKFFIKADIKTRALRRYETLKEKNVDISLEQVEQDLKQRDYEDSHREISPLKKADDAIVIDTSNDTIEESLNRILSYIRS